MAKILCVDDDAYLTDLLRYALSREGFEVSTANSGREALRLVQGKGIDLVILDVNIPDMNGFRVLAALRGFSQAPVVMLTARAQDEDIVAGFDSGADDYVVKPFSMQVLSKRVSAVLQRTRTRPLQTTLPGRRYRIGSGLFDSEAHEIVSPVVSVRLTPTEGRILHLLLMHEGQVLSAERIMEHIWGYNTNSNVGVIKTHIRHVREKIYRLPDCPQPIRTLTGLGYTAHQIDESGAILAS